MGRTRGLDPTGERHRAATVEGEIEWTPLRPWFPDHRFFSYVYSEELSSSIAHGWGCMVVSRFRETIRDVSSVHRIAKFLREDRIPVLSSEPLAALLRVRGGWAVDPLGRIGTPWPRDAEIEAVEDGWRVGLPMGVYRFRLDGDGRVMGFEEEAWETCALASWDAFSHGTGEGAAGRLDVGIELGVHSLDGVPALYRVCPMGNGAEVLTIGDRRVRWENDREGWVGRARILPDEYRRLGDRLREIGSSGAREAPVQVPREFKREKAVWGSVRVTRNGEPAFEGRATGPLWDEGGVATGSVRASIRAIVDALRSQVHTPTSLTLEEKEWAAGFFLREGPTLPRAGFDRGLAASFQRLLRLPWVAAGTELRICVEDPSGRPLPGAEVNLLTPEGRAHAPFESGTCLRAGEIHPWTRFAFPAGFYRLEARAPGHVGTAIPVTIGAESPQELVVRLDPERRPR
ncbi:MAG: carboxypeptidase-like regulatory domain-containing protein [Planctomycetes bacterium]|nr:carboxypeptidase-like regulatory domain-containing protein [Planctomycetota bacterium]